MTTPPDNAVDTYLDQLFDQLAGSGRRGRRVLAEAEDHLQNATEELLAQGLDRDAAQQEAVARFGNARQVATTVPGARTDLITAARRLTTMVWLLTSLAVLTYGLSGILTWILGWPYGRLLAANDGVEHGALKSIDGNYLNYGFPLWATVVGLILLAALVIARRYTRVGQPAWTPSRSVSSVIVTTLFGIAAFAFLYQGVAGMLETLQAWALADLVAALVCVAIGTLAWRRRRTPLPKAAAA
jgi:hypothetical protein